ncbi:hypothetical protein EP7_004760 [Isosphaeraceae bacterium EP7]
MTFEECQATLDGLRTKQKTEKPAVRVAFAGTTYQGRIIRADTDAQVRAPRKSRYGVLVLEQLGLVHGPETVLQIADIPANGIKGIYEG